ncbi:hypothetical protein BDBG_16318, partial [Blastomyces gilchristii SLH14081]
TTPTESSPSPPPPAPLLCLTPLPIPHSPFPRPPSSISTPNPCPPDSIRSAENNVIEASCVLSHSADRAPQSLSALLIIYIYFNPTSYPTYYCVSRLSAPSHPQ